MADNSLITKAHLRQTVAEIAEELEALESASGGVPTATAASSDGVTYTATVSGISSLTIGQSIMFVPSKTSASAAPTLNVNGLGAKTIKRRLSNLSSTTTSGASNNWLYANKPQLMTYDGTYWIVVNQDKPAASDLYGSVDVAKGGTGLTTVTAGSFLIGDGTNAMIEKTPAEVLNLINGASVQAVTTAEYEALASPASNTIYALTDTEEESHVLYTEQTLTDEQKAQARENISAQGRVIGTKGQYLGFDSYGNPVPKYFTKETFDTPIETEIGAVYLTGDIQYTDFLYKDLITTNPTDIIAFLPSEEPGGTYSLTFDNTELSTTEIIVFFFKNGEMYRCAMKNDTLLSGNVDFSEIWIDPSTQTAQGFAKLTGDITFTVPDDCTVLLELRFKYESMTTFPEGSSLALGTTAAEWAKSGGIRVTQLFSIGQIDVVQIENTPIEVTINPSALFVKSIAHRGALNDAPENTLPAFLLAKQQGYDYTELDVRFTSDGIPVLLHDETIDRTSNGTGYVSSMTLAQLKALDFGSWFSEDFAGTQIPTLEEAMVFCRNIGLNVIIDIQECSTATKAQTLVGVVNKSGMKYHTRYTCFYIEPLTFVKEIDSKAQLGIICNDITNETIANANSLKTDENSVMVNAWYKNLTDQTVQLCIDANLPLETFFADTKEDMINLHPYVSGACADTLHFGTVLYEHALVQNGI